MKTTFKTILDSVPALQTLTKMSFRASEAVALSRLVKKLDGELKVFDNVRKNYEKKYENEELMKHLNSLLGQECEEYEKITLTLSEDNSIDAATILNCEEFIDFVIKEDKDNGQ
ncbi:MAG: hypothetical protein IKJ27_00235 [Clostridia bacterium]|nr:hypothetical protein [Clostridia bacterium]